MVNNMGCGRKAFLLCKNMTPPEVRYYLHKLEHVDTIDPELLSEAEKCEKNTKVLLTLAKPDEKIVEKYGRLTNTLVNYQILALENGSRMV